MTSREAEIQARVDAIQECHYPLEVAHSSVCGGCKGAWPCDTASSVPALREAADDLLARVATLEAQVAAVRAAVDDCPPCDVHPDGDPITCGWKGAVADVRSALDSAVSEQDKGES